MTIEFMTEQYPWSDSGKELLSNVKALIQRNGGRHLMYHKVKRETNKRIYKFKETNDPIPVSVNSIIFNNWHKLTISEISELVNLPQGTVYWRGRWLGLPNKGTSLLKNNKKMVLNIETGIFYETSKDAAFSIGFTQQRLSKKLTGQFKNNTSFIRV